MNANLSSYNRNIADTGWKHHFDKLSEFKAEKRRYARYQAQYDVMCTVYDLLEDDFEIFEANVKNESKTGLLLTMNRQLEIGTPVLVQLKDCSEKNAENELKDGIHAQVVRCDKIFHSEEKFYNQTAIEYFELCQ
jgi:hypothetical protein